MNNSQSLTLEEYQKRAMDTCMESCENITYMLTNLTAEVGELAGKVAKAVRKGKVKIDDNRLEFTEQSTWNDTTAIQQDFLYEAGDVLWQLAGLCTVLHLPLEYVAEKNLAKLADRKKRGVIDGTGDNR